jgi:hypothetical protein
MRIPYSIGFVFTIFKAIKELMLFAILLHSVGALAQNNWQFVDESSLRLPDTTAFGLGVDAGDVNNNGSLDILNACLYDSWLSIPGYEHLYFNNGSGYFSLAQHGEFPLFNDDSEQGLLFDCDGDSDLDAFIVNSNHVPDYIAVNDGFGNFSVDSSRLIADPITSIVANYTDIDGDGDIDIVELGNALNGPNMHRVWINIDNLFFENQTFRLPELNLIYSTVEFSDVDGDLDVDLLVNDRWDPGQPRILINDGEGYFVDETNSRFPPTLYSLNSNFSDLDNDDDFDIILGYQGRCGFLINDGSGIFADETNTRGPEFPFFRVPNKMKTADMDNDGDEDILLGIILNRDLVFVNTGNGFFEDQSSIRLPNQPYSTRDLVLADLDDDGDIDCFRTGTGLARNTIYINTLNTPDTLPPEIKNKTVFSQMVSDFGPYPVKIVSTDGVSIENGQLLAKVNYSYDLSTYFESDLHYTGGYMFYGEIPAVDSGITINYYYSVEDKEGNRASIPRNYPDSVLSFAYLPINTSICDSGYASLPYEFKVNAYPNPFNSSTTITIKNAKGGESESFIFDVNGRLIRVLNMRQVSNNEQTVNWDGTTSSYEEVPSGIYFVLVRTGGIKNVFKLTCIR